jgi:hypothetical protein
MNREDNLLASIDSWIDCHEKVNDIMIIDWSSSNRLYDNNHIKKLIDDKKINLVEVVEEKYFSLPKAYNLAYIKSSNKYIIKLDSDYKLLNSTIIDRVTKINDTFLRGSHKSGHYHGFFAIERSNFLYYNENLNGWGYDDLDLYYRLSASGIKQQVVSDLDKYIYHIPHSNNDSTQNYLIKNKAYSEKQNRILAQQSFEVSKYETIYKENNYEKVKRIC